MGSACCVCTRRYDRPLVSWEGAAAAEIADVRNERLSRESVSMQSKAHVSGLPEDQLLPLQVKTKENMMPANEGQTLSPLHDMPSSSQLSTSPLPCNFHLAPASSTPSKWFPHVPRSHFFRQGSDNLVCAPSNYSESDGTSSPMFAVSSIESTRHSHGGSIDGLSVQSFPESTTSTHKKAWSFDRNSLGSHHFKLAQSQSHKADTQSNELKTCVICSKCVSVYSVVAVLACGHGYHADCLENMTPEISKYDPTCPVCTMWDKGAMKMMDKLLKQDGRVNAKMFGKLLNNKMDTKGKNKTHRNRVINSDLELDIPLGSNRDHESIPSLRSSLAKPFLKRQFLLQFQGK